MNEFENEAINNDYSYDVSKYEENQNGTNDSDSDENAESNLGKYSIINILMKLIFFFGCVEN